jgi:hypothetical protein
VTTLTPPAWAWLALAAALIIVLACGFLALFGAGVRVISRNDPAPRDEPRVPAGHSGV